MGVWGQEGGGGKRQRQTEKLTDGCAGTRERERERERERDSMHEGRNLNKRTPSPVFVSLGVLIFQSVTGMSVLMCELSSP